jgi:hypothetical protein
MTTKEKAKELIEKYDLILEGLSIHFDVRKNFVYKITLLAIDEILKSLIHNKLIDNPYTTLEARQYYVQVKIEIEKIKNGKK